MEGQTEFQTALKKTVVMFKTLTGKDGEPRVFAKLDTAARQLMALGLSTFEVEGGRYEAAQLRPDRPDRSRAMKAAYCWGSSSPRASSCGSCRRVAVPCRCASTA